MSKHLVLIGGGHAHMVTLQNIQTIISRGHKVTVIGPSAYHYYSGMGPGMLSRVYTPDDIRFATRHVVEKQGGTFILDKVIQIAPLEKSLTLESGRSISYDVLSCNAGSYVPQGLVTGDSDCIYSVKPIEKLLAAQKHLEKLFAERPVHIGVIGGGPSSLEIAGNIWRLAKDSGGHTPSITVFAGKNFMGRFPSSIRSKARQSLQRRNIEIHTGYVRKVSSNEVILESGESCSVDLVFLATGVKPSTLFEESGLPTGPDGGLLVNRYLQSTGHPEIFGGGDCIYFKDQPLDKVGVYAVRQNPILYHNLLASLEGNELIPFDPGGDYLLIFNLGDGTGILHKRGFTMGGRPAFLIKDYIDRKFMKKFQAME
jgi:NADH dehydrogenase FAD-containing subunit